MSRYSGFWISCSIDTKQKLDELFSSANYNRTVEHVIVNSIRLFSLIEFKKSNIDYSKMLVIPKAGIDKINQLCYNLQDEKDIRNMIWKYFKYHYNGKCLQNTVNDKLISLLASHYYNNRDRSMYCEKNVLGRYLCLIYPVSSELSMGINALIKTIQLSKSDDIIRDRIRFM